MQMVANNEGDSELSVLQVPEFMNIPDALIDVANEFREAMMMYNCAMREIKTKFEVLNDELTIRNKRNPIEMIKSRIKKPKSIIDKLQRKGFPLTLESMVDNLNDIAGIRVICSFVDDIYSIVNMLAGQDDINILCIKDYIKNPKSNGYRSYHMIVEIPVFFSDKKKNMRVEIQVRTIAMDFWASLEHQLKYKKDVECSKEIVKELKECANIIAMTDKKMLEIRQAIEE